MTALALHPYTQALAWALVHFLWQGAAIGLIALALRRLTRLSASSRYATGIMLLAAMLAAPVITFVRLAGTTPAAASVQSPSASKGADVTARTPDSSSEVTSVPAAFAPDRSRILISAAILSLWCAGVMFLSLRLLGGWIVARRLAHRSRKPAGPEIQALARRVAGRLSLDRLVGVFESSVVTVPVMIGWMKPVVLLPAAALSGLSIGQVEAVLAHELAHVRRHDYLANLLQSVVETLLFYHPAVWWLSRRVRADRELCCDDIALGVCDRVVYATALTRLAAMAAPPQVALAATDGPLLTRVRRILGQSVDQSESGAAWLPVFFAVLIVGSILPAALASARVADPQAAKTPVVASTQAPKVEAAVVSETSQRERQVAAEVSQPQTSADEAKRLEQEADARARAIQAELDAIQQQRMELEVHKADIEAKARLASTAAQLEALRKQIDEVKRKVSAGVASPSDLGDLQAQITAAEQKMQVEQAEREFLMTDAELRRREVTLRRDAENQDADRVALKRKMEAIDQQAIEERAMKEDAAQYAVARQKFERMQELYQKGLVTKQTLLDAEASAGEYDVIAEGAWSDQGRALYARVLETAMPDSALTDVLKEATRIAIDRERAQVLIAVARRQSLSADLVSLFVSAAKSIRSDDERARVFAQPVRLRQLK